MKRINVTQSSMPDFEEYCKEIKGLWDTKWLTNMGEKHNQLEHELEQFLDVDNVCLTNNGHAALEIAIQSLNLKGDIITTPFTFISTTHSIIRSGCNPIFCDIQLSDYTIDTKKIESLITKNTVAILPVHVYGNICNIEEIDRIAKENNLKVIYDAAHAFGETYKDINIAGFGDISCFSFHATKVFHTVEGGAVCFKNNSLKETVKGMIDFGIDSDGNINNIGCNAKLNEFSASMGLCNLKNLKKNISKRKAIVY